MLLLLMRFMGPFRDLVEEGPWGLALSAVAAVVDVAVAAVEEVGDVPALVEGFIIGGLGLTLRLLAAELFLLLAALPLPLPLLPIISSCGNRKEALADVLAST